jgi:hypothetical protein
VTPMPEHRLSIREGLVVAAGLLALVTLQLVAADAAYLLHKNFWLDELHTLAVAADESQIHAMRAHRSAIEGSPPTLGLILSGYTALANSTSELTFRSLFLATMIFALVGVYAGLRLAYGRLVALAATLAIWCHPLVQHHAFEVRFYGPLFAAAIWFCYLLERARTPRVGRWNTLALAISSLFLCTIHYFGILALLVVVSATWIWHYGRPGYTRGAMAGVALGPLVLVILALLFLPPQRAALSVSSWVEDPSPAAIANLGLSLFLPLHLGAVVITAWFSGLWKVDRRSTIPPDEDRDPSALVGMTSLVLLFPVLVAFSYVVQPALVSRYVIAAVAGIAPAVAFSVARMRRPWVLLLIGFFVVASGYELQRRGQQARAEDAQTRELIEAIRTRTGDDPVLFETPHKLYVVWHYAADLRHRVFLLDFDRDEFDHDVSRLRIFTRDLARQFRKFYPAAGLMHWDHVQQARTVYLVPDDEAWADAPPAPRERYRGFEMLPLSGSLHQLVRAHGN